MRKGIYTCSLFSLCFSPLACAQMDMAASPAFEGVFVNLVSGGLFTAMFIFVGIIALVVGGLKFMNSGETGPLFVGVMLAGAPIMLRLVLGIDGGLDDATAAGNTTDSEGFDLSTFILAAVIIVAGVGLILFKLVSDARERTRVDALLERIANEMDEDDEESQDNVPSLNELAAREASSGSGKVISTAEPAAASEPVHKNKRKVILD